jgi:hypothetical protein
MKKLITPVGTAEAVFAGIALVLLPSTLYAQRISQEDASGIFVSASSNVFRASARVFDCLDEARRGKQGSTDRADEALDNAIKAYKRLADDRASTQFRPGDDPGVKGVVDQVNLLIASSPAPGWTGVRSLKMEGDVAQLNIDAINQLKQQLKAWKNCVKPSNNVNEYIVFIKNKINLELSSQVAEIAFKKN